ncbi:hypothetical protein CALVIDRAFT_594346 [Calocera viscosa TUFC12733]|uniref:Oxo-4-hydroxy-4-carboxy-5-ureidoimidazoline decarboxylase domain-containing protein n=1 Tax=Calocera viscosa (strain TUFC12733) TaxID=1330018 RepID=A0A167S7M3_CALVF|nr:hypothetical protein CALVIDRAFT_594346 [Calocera viscosa TUFC12733]
MTGTTIPTLDDVTSPYDGVNHPLAQYMQLVFEPSSTIEDNLPALHAALTANPPKSHADVIDAFAAIVKTSPWRARTPLLTAHPAIGQKKKLSALSATEQRSSETVDPSVQEELIILNRAYETKYPGLRYVTWVNGRTKAQIAEEMKRMLEVHTVESIDPSVIVPYVPGSSEWIEELDRGAEATMNIAKDRTNKLLL